MSQFAILDTETGKFWCTPKDKYTWKSASAAKNAWNCHCMDNLGQFSEQTRFKCHKVGLKLVQKKA